MKSSFAVGTLVGLTMLPVWAEAAPYGMYYTHQYRAKLEATQILNHLSNADLNNAASVVGGPKGKKKLVYRGGPVLSQAKVYAVMWGNSVNSATQTQIGGLFSSLLRSNYMDFLSQYSTRLNAADGRAGSQQSIGYGMFADTVVINPSNQKLDVTDQEVAAELENQINNGTLPKPDANTVYMTYFPAGMSIDLYGNLSCQAYCGYHHNATSSVYGKFYYGVVPDVGSGGCALGCNAGASVFEDLTIVTSHELAEMITDPAVDATASAPCYPDGWNTDDGQEVGDLCTGQITQLNTGSGSGYVIQQEFDNKSGTCAAGPYSTR